MTKADLIDKIYKSKKVPKGTTKKAVTAVVEATFSEIKNAVKKEDRFSYPQFGTFAKRKRKARSGRNPRTGAKITIPARTTVAFRPASSLKTMMGGRKKK